MFVVVTLVSVLPPILVLLPPDVNICAQLLCPTQQLLFPTVSKGPASFPIKQLLITDDANGVDILLNIVFPLTVLSLPEPVKYNCCI